MDNKRYFWIKLKTNFFNQDTIDFLLSQNNGCEYVVLYQMLCLKTANNNGVLSTNIGEIIVPYDVEKIARDTKYFSEDTIRVALELYKQLGLIYEDKDNLLQITNINEMVGSNFNDEHYKEQNRIRQQRYRDKQKLLNSNVTLTDNVALNSNVDIRDKSIEYRDKILDIRDIDNINNNNIKEKLKEKEDISSYDWINDDEEISN